MTIIQEEARNKKKAHCKDQSETVVGKTHEAEGTAGPGGEPAVPIFLLSV